MARTAGAVADGVVAHPMATLRYIDEVMRPAIAEGAEREGRPSGDVAIADWLVVAIADDPDQAREDAKRQIAFHATVRTYDGILDLHGFGETAAAIRELWRSFDLAGMTALVTDEMLDAMAVAGTPAECRERRRRARRGRRPPADRGAGGGDRPRPDPRVPRRDRGNARKRAVVPTGR